MGPRGRVVSTTRFNSSDPQEMEFRREIRRAAGWFTSEELMNGNLANHNHLYLSIYYLYLLILQHIIDWENLPSRLDFDWKEFLTMLTTQLRYNHNKRGEGEWCLTRTQMRQISDRMWDWLTSHRGREEYRDARIILKEECYSWRI